MHGQAGALTQGPSVAATPTTHVHITPPAKRARRAAFVLAIIAVAFALACGFTARRTYALRDDPDQALPWAIAALVLLLVTLLVRMGAAIAELLWLERTWSNLPPHLHRVGPVENVSSGIAIVVSFVPGVAWLWKLGLVVAIAKGFEAIRAVVPFQAPVPRKLGMAAVITSWIPGLNVYVAPFLWEAFAVRIDAVVEQIGAATALPAAVPSAIPEGPRGAPPGHLPSPPSPPA